MQKEIIEIVLTMIKDFVRKRPNTSFGISLIFIVVIGLLIAGVTNNTDDDFDGYYYITAKHSEKSLTVSSSSLDRDEANICQEPYDELETKDTQLWRIIPVEIGYYKIVSKYSGKCIDVSGVSKDNGANIYQYECHGGTNQLWSIIPIETNSDKEFYRIVSKHSGKCIDVQGSSNDNGANVYQYECHGHDNQLWSFTKIK